MLNLLFDSLLELQVGTMIACMPAMSQSCRRLVPVYDRLRGSLTRYYHIGLLSGRSSKESDLNKDTLVGAVNLYESDGATAGQPTRKDRYELYGNSKTMQSKTLLSEKGVSDGPYRQI